MAQRNEKQEKNIKNQPATLKNALVALFSRWSLSFTVGVLHLRAAWLFVLVLLKLLFLLMVEDVEVVLEVVVAPSGIRYPLSAIRHPPAAIASGSFVLTIAIAVACTRLHLFNAASALAHTAYACSAKFHTRNFSVSTKEQKK